jgi:hypothetical protein
MKRKFGNTTIQADTIYPISIEYDSLHTEKKYYVTIQTSRDIIGIYGQLETIYDEATIKITAKEYTELYKEIFD